MKGHKGHHHRAGGGRTEMWVAGNPSVHREAEGKEPYSKKRGGRAKHHRAAGGAVTMHGGAVRPRLDRPGRKRGGRVGSDTSPLTSAHNVSSSESLPKESADAN